MPFYEYKCSNCGHELEELQSITAAPLVKCPECGKDTLQRLIGTGAGLIFKGSGFYLTDYKNQNSKSRGGGEKKPEKVGLLKRITRIQRQIPKAAVQKVQQKPKAAQQENLKKKAGKTDVHSRIQ